MPDNSEGTLIQKSNVLIPSLCCRLAKIAGAAPVWNATRLTGLEAERFFLHPRQLFTTDSGSEIHEQIESFKVKRIA